MKYELNCVNKYSWKILPFLTIVESEDSEEIGTRTPAESGAPNTMAGPVKVVELDEYEDKEPPGIEYEDEEPPGIEYEDEDSPKANKTLRG